MKAQLSFTHGVEAPIDILLVDDEPRNLDVLEGVLEAPDCRFVRASSGEEALMALIQGEFAAIVLDIQMPGMNGLEVAKLIKQRRRNQHIPILFLTAYYQEEKDVLQGYGAGAVDYLTKPIDPKILKSKVNVFVELARTTRALARANDALEAEIARRTTVEEELRESNNQLEARVQQRTAELTWLNEELRESSAQIREIAEAERLRRHELETLMEVASVAIWIAHDAECRHISGNSASYAMLRLPPGEQLSDGQREFDVYSNGELVSPAEMPMKRAARSGMTLRNQELEFRFQDGTSIWAYGTATPLKDENGAVTGVLSIFADITERKRTEEALRKAKAQAEAASKAKDEFLATLSHELRTPLNPALLIASDREKEGSLPQPVRDAFSMIRQGIELEVSLIDDLLDLTRIANRKLRLESAPLDIHFVIYKSWDLVRGEASEKRLTVQFDLSAAEPWVGGDSVRMQQVFWNLLRNATRFTPDQGLIVVRSTCPRPGWLMVEITDSGIGIEAHELEGIFRPFEQGQMGPRSGGLGLGLAITRALVELHGGKVSATSAGRGRGSTFLIELPMILPPADPDANSADSASHTMRPSGKRILLVEDHHQTRTTLTHLLVQQGHEVRAVEGVSQARKAATDFPFEVVLSDLGLPDGNGYEMMEELRRMRPLCVGIALSGYGMETDVERSLRAGFNLHLTKPLKFQTLKQALSQLCPQLQEPRAEIPQPADGFPGSERPARNP